MRDFRIVEFQARNGEGSLQLHIGEFSDLFGLRHLRRVLLLLIRHRHTTENLSRFQIQIHFYCQPLVFVPPDRLWKRPRERRFIAR